ncbi:hypothetical protein DL95DRAFT_473275 [Leptodontidium sp. 2 PMI_412]|nr:hypothetical protein DL95DRAFT_473275 [Leptodontidium sp. 2 PMI_412]
MPMWTCDVEICQRPAVRTLGDCILCNRHLCAKHLQSAVHDCPRWEDSDSYDPAAREAERQELTRLFDKINTSALAAQASSLRQGIACSVPLQYDRATRSSMGATWLARIRRFNATSPPPALRDYIIQCEVATFDSLRNWRACSEEKKVIHQLADIFIELRKFSFDRIGSLDQPGESHVGLCARESLTDFTASKMEAIGPCSSLEEYHVASIRLILDLIIRDEIYTQQAVDAYLIHRFLLDLVPSILSPTMQGSRSFYLKHADDKGDHILVDDDFNITGIIDWEWAYTTSEALAFNSPIVLLPAGEFYNGVNDLGDYEITFAQLLEEKGSPDLADFVRKGRLQHRFAFCCGYDLADWAGFLGLFRGLRDAVGVDEGLDWDSWKTAALNRYKDDERLQILLSRAEQM